MIHYIDRKSGTVCTEKVFGQRILNLLYGTGFFSWFLYRTLLPLLSRWPLASRVYGWHMKRASSRAKVAPFIRLFGIDTSEFASHEFNSFNDFFIRKLNPKCRPVVAEPDRVACPADGRYFVYPKFDRFFAKGQEFCLAEFLQDRAYGKRFSEGSMVIARLCPVDYHRFHFPCEGVPGEAKLINGFLYSVNPIALKKRIQILSQNKRFVTEIETEKFGTVLFIEIGATSVGSVQQTYEPGERVAKGQEKGYFEFGGSCIVLLFEKGRVQFDADLVENTRKGLETLCRFGSSLGHI